VSRATLESQSLKLKTNKSGFNRNRDGYPAHLKTGKGVGRCLRAWQKEYLSRGLPKSLSPRSTSPKSPGQSPLLGGLAVNCGAAGNGSGAPTARMSVPISLSRARNAHFAVTLRRTISSITDSARL